MASTDSNNKTDSASVSSTPSPAQDTNTNSSPSSTTTPSEATTTATAAAPAGTKSASLHKCPMCTKPATKRCSRCQQVWYCSADCQKRHWKTHKSFCNSVFQSNQYELHKKAFDAIIQKYNLKEDKKAAEIAELLTNGVEHVTAPEFASKFGMDVPEAVTFLEWIKIGINFKEQSIDTAKKAGMDNISKVTTFKADATRR